MFRGLFSQKHVTIAHWCWKGRKKCRPVAEDISIVISLCVFSRYNRLGFVTFPPWGRSTAQKPQKRQQQQQLRQVRSIVCVNCVWITLPSDRYKAPTFLLWAHSLGSFKQFACQQRCCSEKRQKREERKEGEAHRLSAYFRCLFSVTLTLPLSLSFAHTHTHTSNSFSFIFIHLHTASRLSCTQAAFVCNISK